jgi:hypothetical protein
MTVITNTITVLCQTDAAFSSISSNQCSWCAALFAKHAKELKQYFVSNDTKMFLEIYNKCLQEGSLLRKQYGTKLYGENIDNERIKKYVELETVADFTLLANEDPTFLELLPDDLKYEFYKNIHIKIDDLSVITGNLFAMISRHGQSFTVVPVTSDIFLIFDSHVHIVRTMNKEEMEKYVKCDHGGYLHLTIILGL